MNEPRTVAEPEHSVLADQAEEQRAAMLREMAEQRERMGRTGNAEAGEPVEAELARMPEHAGESIDGTSSPTGAVVPEQDRSPAEDRKLGLLP